MQLIPIPYMQLSHSYSVNTKMPQPCHLHFVSWKGDIKAKGEAQIAGMANWPISTTADSYIEYFADRKDKLVYLTADSDNELEEVDPKSIYIIGGLVDHNRCV